MKKDFCPYCGNPDVKILKSKEWNCPACNNIVYKDFATRALSLSEKSSLTEEELEKIIKEDWKYYLENKDGDWNLSNHDLKECQKLYDIEPNDSDNVLRLFTVKLCAGMDCKDLALQFIKLWEKTENLLGHFDELFYIQLLLVHTF